MKVLALLACVLGTAVALTVVGILFTGGVAGTAAAAAPQRLTIHVLDDRDTMRGPYVVVHPGRVVLTIANHAHHAHLFAVPGLGVRKLVVPAHLGMTTSTSVSFVVRRDGMYEWYCLLPCGKRMAGVIYVTHDTASPRGSLWADATA